MFNSIIISTSSFFFVEIINFTHSTCIYIHTLGIVLFSFNFDYIIIIIINCFVVVLLIYIVFIILFTDHVRYLFKYICNHYFFFHFILFLSFQDITIFPPQPIYDNIIFFFLQILVPEIPKSNIWNRIALALTHASMYKIYPSIHLLWWFFFLLFRNDSRII